MIVKLIIESGENIRSAILLAGYQSVKIRAIETDLEPSYYLKGSYTEKRPETQVPVMKKSGSEYIGPAIKLFDLLAERRLSPQTKEYILKALDAHSSIDNLERCKLAFKDSLGNNLAMQELYGESGKTKQEIYNEYSKAVCLEETARLELGML